MTADDVRWAGFVRKILEFVYRGRWSWPDLTGCLNRPGGPNKTLSGECAMGKIISGRFGGLEEPEQDNEGRPKNYYDEKLTFLNLWRSVI